MNRRRVFALVIGVVAMLLLVGFYYIHSNQQFRLVKTDPGNNSSPVNVLSPVTYYFNRSMAATKAPTNQTGSDGRNYITTSPTIAGAITISDSQIIFTPVQPFVIGLKYVLTLHKVTDSDNEVLGDITINFTPKYSNYTSLPTQVQQQQQSRTDVSEDIPPKELQLRNKLPYFGAGFSVEWNQTGNFYNVTVLANPVASMEAAGVTYLKSQGVDTNQRQVVYTLSPGLNQ